MTATTPPNPSPSSSDDRAWAGRVVFPRSSAELRSTTVCPACFVPLTSTVCRSCGLDLRHEASVELARASAAAADAVDARLDIIGRIRRDTAAGAVAGAAPVVAPVAAPVAAAAAAPAAPAAAPVHTAASAATPAAAHPAPAASAGETAAPRRSGIQIALIVVGVSLLSVFAVFALVFAFVTYGTEVRMAIITGGTLLTMIAAGALKRRGLDATGEGIAVLGTVMFVLTAWALRVDSPIGLESVTDALYWGVALLIIAAVCGLWALTNRLSTPDIVAAALLPVGAGLLTGHLVDELLPTVSAAAVTAAALAALATAALSWRLVRESHPRTRRAARIIAQSIGSVAATVALVALGALDADNRWAPVIAGLVLAALAALHVVTSARAMPAPRRGLDVVTLSALGGGAVVAAMAGAVLSALRFDQERVIVSAPVIAAVVLAVVAEQGWRRSPAGSASRTAFASATIVAATHAAIAGGLAAIVGASAFAEAATQSLRTLPLELGDPVTSANPATSAALGALALSIGLIAASWATLGLLVHRSRVITLLGGVVLVASVPLVGAWWLVMLVFTLFAIGGAVALYGLDRVAVTDARRALLALSIVLTAGGALGAFLTGWAVTRGGIVGLIVAVLAIGVARPAARKTIVRAAAVALAALLVLGSTPALARDAAAIGLPELGSAAALVLVSAIILALLQLGQLSELERRVGSAVTGSIAVVATMIIGVSTLPGAAATDRTAEVVALVALTLALAVIVWRQSAIERVIARAVLPIVVAVGTLAVIAPFDLDAAVSAVVVVSALGVVAALGLVIPGGRTAPHFPHERMVGDISASVIALGVVGVAATATVNGLWAPVLALAVLALVTAISRDGLIGSSSPRRFVGWVALALGTGSLWLALAERDVTEPEFFALPLAGALLLIAGANALVARRVHDRADRTAAPLVAGALLVALVPTALASIDGTVARYVAVAVIATALAIAPLLRVTAIDGRVPMMSSALVSTGFVSLGLLTVVHSVDLVVAGEPARGTELVRAVVIVALPAAAAVAAWIIEAGRLRYAVTAGGVGVAALGAGLLGLTAIVDPVELVSLPLAASLIAIGAVRMDEQATARSWPWLAPGVGVLLVPSLLAIDGAGEPLWRAIAIGVVAATLFVVALRLKLQAPFVIAGVVLLVHLLVQSWPLLEQVGQAVDWWIWLGLAGVIVIALAARYERRLQNVRDVAVRISQLR
jgi:hypothetical protein